MNTIKFCAKCGAPIGPEEKFCGGCGASVAEMEAEAGISTQQAAPLSSSFPRHCLLFVCAFFRKMQAGSWSEELPLPPVSCIQNRPGFHHGNRGDSFALGALFQALTQNLAKIFMQQPLRLTSWGQRISGAALQKRCH